MLLKIFTHKRLIGKTHVMSYFLYALRGVLQLHAKLHNDIIVNPVVRRALAYLLDRFRKILGRDAHLMGIPAYASLRSVVLFHKTYESGENGFGTSLFLVVAHLNTVYGVAEIVNHCRDKHSYNILTEMFARLVNLLFNEFEIVNSVFYLVGLKLKYRVAA